MTRTHRPPRDRQFQVGDIVAYRVLRWTGRAMEYVPRQAGVIEVLGNGRCRVLTDHDLGQRRTFSADQLEPFLRLP